MKRIWLYTLLMLLATWVAAPAEAGESKRLLVITESKGFRHGCVTRKVTLAKGVDAKQLPQIEGLEVIVDKKGGVRAAYHDRVDARGVDVKNGRQLVARVEPCLVETTFMNLGKQHGFEVVCSQNSRGEITAENLKRFDAVWFYTTGELPLSDVQKADLLGFVRSGKGFGGSHSATDTFYKWNAYGDLIGAYFAGHPPGLQKIRVVVEDRKHPATRHFGGDFEIQDEIYKFKGPYGRDKVRVLLRVDMKSTKNFWREDGDNPLAWVREYGKGRVFYTALGHDDKIWRDERYQQHLVGALRYLFRLEDADATPSAVTKEGE